MGKNLKAVREQRAEATVQSAVSDVVRASAPTVSGKTTLRRAALLLPTDLVIDCRERLATMMRTGQQTSLSQLAEVAIRELLELDPQTFASVIERHGVSARRPGPV